MTSHKIKELISLGVRFFYCSQCLETRGIEESQIADNVEKSNLPKLADFIKKSEKVITFLKLISSNLLTRSSIGGCELKSLPKPPIKGLIIYI